MSPATAAANSPTLADIQRRLKELLSYRPQQASQPSMEELEQLEQPEPPYPASPHPEPEPAQPEPPPTLTAAALHGLAGDTVRSLAPHSEADPAAILLQFLAAFGNLVGPTPHALVGSARHGLNLFVVLVGESSKARKGTSWRQVSSLFTEVDPGWARRRVSNTRPTPAGILKSLRGRQPANDSRLLLVAEEFVSVLYDLGRRSGQLSSLLRCAWDGGDLTAHDGHHCVDATAAHLSLVGHITPGKLVQHLSRKEAHNGFANRCLWASVRRGHSLPSGGSLPADQSAALAGEISRAAQWAAGQTTLLFRRSPAAETLWIDSYPTLSVSRPDALGAATSRAEAQALRLSAIYAALDCSSQIETCHLEAARAVWDYCQASAALFFDGAPTDPVAHRINAAIGASPNGLSRTQITALFHGHVSVQRIDLALEQLSTLGLLFHHTAAGRGRPATLWTKPQNNQQGT